MKKLLCSLAFGLCSLTAFAQPSPLYSYNLPLRQINTIAYDSIAILDGMNPQGPALRWAQYLFYQNQYVAGGRANDGQQSLEYHFAVNTGKPETIELDQSTGDTLRSITYFGNGNGQDSAIKVFDYQSSAAPKLSRQLKYFYTPSGEVDSIYSVNYQADTIWYASYTKNYFSGNRIDSVITQRLPSPTRFRTVNFYNAQNRLQYSENYSNITGSESYSGRDTYLYNTNDQVKRIDVELALPGSQVLVPFEIIEFHKSPAFSLGEERTTDIQIYPNPASDFINVKADTEDLDQSYEILSLIGKLVQKGVLKEQIDIRLLQSGFYILRLSSSKATYRFKKV